MKGTINNVEYNVVNGEMEEQEIEKYIAEIQSTANGKVSKVSLVLDDEYVNVSYEIIPQGFFRIRRITGYLTGSTDRWNDAKQAELEARVKHC